MENSPSKKGLNEFNMTYNNRTATLLFRSVAGYSHVAVNYPTARVTTNLTKTGT